MLFSEKDKTILRDAARRVAEIATHPRQDKTKQLWRRMNGLERTRPPVLLLDGTKHETGDKIKLECEGEDARAQEWGLRNRIYKWENLTIMMDDGRKKWKERTWRRPAKRSAATEDGTRQPGLASNPSNSRNMGSGW